MRTDFPYYSKYRDTTIIAERNALAKAEHEMNQKKGKFITKDDILDLRILLETCKSIEKIYE